MASTGLIGAAMLMNVYLYFMKAFIVESYGKNGKVTFSNR
jgi:hypothetical protein